MCACRDDTDLITSLPPPPPHLKTPKRFLVTFRTLGFEAWRASSPCAGFSQGCQHPVFSAPSPSSPCTLPSPCSSCLIPPPVTPTPDVVRVLFYVPAAPRPSARPTRSVFSHGLQVPNLNQIHQPLKPHVLPVAPRVPGPQHSPCAGGDASAPCLVPLWAQMSSRLWKGGQQSSARRSRRVSSEPFFLSVAVGLVYAHRAPERLFSSLGRGCGGLTLSLFLVFQDGSYLAEFLLEKGYEVSP